MKALIAIKVTEPANFDEILNSREYSTLRMYLSSFSKTTKGEFISAASVVKHDEGKYTIDKEDIDFKLTLLDWGFNEPEEADKFYNIYHNIHWNMRVLCEI